MCVWVCECGGGRGGRGSSAVGHAVPLYAGLIIVTEQTEGAIEKQLK